MRLVKHNAIENFSTFTKNEKEDLIIQEMSKAFLLYPQATADILDTCQIEYKSKSPNQFAMAIESHGENLKMLNRLVRLSFLVNKQGDVQMKNHDRNISYRNLMKHESIFLKKNQDKMKEATLLTRSMMREKMFSKILGKSVEHYLNMDGNVENSKEKQVVVEQQVEKKSYTWIWVLGGLSVGAYLYYKFKNK
jgi:hypothetical protein